MEQAIRSPDFIRQVATASRRGHVKPLPHDVKGILIHAESRTHCNLDVSASEIVPIIAEAVARDLDELRTHGDIDSKDVFLSIVDGTRKRGTNYLPVALRVEDVRIKSDKESARITVKMRVRFE